MLTTLRSTKYNAQEKLAMVLSKGHFEERKSVSAHSNVLQACEFVGLPVAEAQDVLQGDQYTEDVWNAFSQAQHRGYHSIPVFIFDRNDTWEVRGSSSIAAFERVIRDIESAYASAY